MARTDDPRPTIARFRALGMPDALIMSRLSLEGWDSAFLTQYFGAAGAPAAPAPLPVLVSSITPLEARATEPRDATPAAAPIVRAVASSQPAPMSVPIGTKHATPWWMWGMVTGAFVLFGAAIYFYFQPPVVYSISIPSAASSTPPLQYGALPALSDRDYYRGVLKNLSTQEVSFIDANLTDMKLRVFINGTSTLEVPILAKGKVGSWWETPAGIYKIQSKETNHLSSIGDVYMPYSLDFQGNFFIHGWPYYEDGTPVSTSYSGGCIRLSTDDAQKVYELVRIGMPVVVYNETPPPDDFKYQLKAPSISATNYLVADLQNGAVLTSNEASSTAQIASITKLVTALVATEYIDLDKMLTVPRAAIVYTSVPRLKAGQDVRAYDLLFLLLQESSNEAAETLAAAKDRDQFVSYMNDKVRSIGLQHTLFSDPSGAKNDLSSPEDLFDLLKYIYDNRRFVLSITTGELTDSAYGTPIFHTINNFNKLKGVNASLEGGKVGETNQAGETYAGIFKVQIGGVDRDIAIIVLNSKDAASDVAQLLNFVHNQYAPAVLAQ